MNNVYLLAIYPRLQAAEQTINGLIAAGYPAAQIGAAVSEIYRDPAHKTVSDTTDREISIYAVRLVQILNRWDGAVSQHVSGSGSLILTGIFDNLTSQSDQFDARLDTIGVPAHHIELILESLRQGDVVVCVQASEDDISEVTELLCHFEPVDIKRREQQWHQRGWQGFDAMSDPYSVEEIIRKKRQYSPPRTNNLHECMKDVVQCYREKTTTDS